MEVRGLFETFLRQLSLPRLVHFSIWCLNGTSMGIKCRTSTFTPGVSYSPALRMMPETETETLRLFVSPSDCNSYLMLVFATRLFIGSTMKSCFSVILPTSDLRILKLRTSTALEQHRKNIQLGLRIGQAALISFTVDGQHMKAIWILMNNKLPSSKGGNDPATRNPFWKFVVPVSYFAWLPASIAHSFCAEALATIPQAQYADPSWSYHNLEDFEGPGNTKRGFGIPATLHGLIPLGDTRDSQELAVFCNMPRRDFGSRVVLHRRKRLSLTTLIPEDNLSGLRSTCSVFC